MSLIKDQENKFNFSIELPMAYGLKGLITSRLSLEISTSNKCGFLWFHKVVKCSSGRRGLWFYSKTIELIFSANLPGFA